MKYATGESKKPVSHQDLANCKKPSPTAIHGAVHALRDMGGLAFVTLRLADGAVQCVCPPALLPEG